MGYHPTSPMSSIHSPEGLTAEPALSMEAQLYKPQQDIWYLLQRDATNQANGTGGAVPLPTQCCGLIHTQTDFAKQSGRGRIYLPFPGCDTTEPISTPSTRQIGLMNNVRNAMCTVTPVTGAGGGTCTLQPSLRCKPRTQGAPVLTFRDITSSNVVIYWATQRRRGAFGQTNPPPV